MTPDQIIDCVTTLTGVTRTDILGNGRTQPVVYARHLTAWALRHRLELSYPHIGAILGLHHTTIIHAVETIEWRRRREYGPADHTQALLHPATC